jgi:hypothetical protein
MVMAHGPKYIGSLIKQLETPTEMYSVGLL